MLDESCRRLITYFQYMHRVSLGGSGLDVKEGAGSAEASACEVLGQTRVCLHILPVVICVLPLGCIVFRAGL